MQSFGGKLLKCQKVANVNESLSKLSSQIINLVTKFVQVMENLERYGIL